VHSDPADAKRVVFELHQFPESNATVPADLKHKADVRLVAAAEGKVVATVTADGVVHAWDTAAGKLLWSAEGEKLKPAALAVAPDGGSVAASFSGKDGKDQVRLFDGKTGKELQRLAGHAGAVNAVAFSGDGKTLVTAGADKTIRVWDAATGKESAVVKGHTDAV